ncbi:putative triacylglycerol lipase [Medicago truncatula]|uniref:Putative triacylglycerol lipase n=1 Tax=Medicago truncatula TaxID=3880 RepID=A0A396J6L4_MEDTR|nr:putative triacylglycerol lipase [Medicago truncatula]
MLGFAKFIPPYANISDSDDILGGVNYASGASGIRQETAKHMGDNVAFGLQISHHKIIVARIAIRLGGFRNAINYLNKCLYYVNIGSNDYINNYYLPQFYPTSRIYNTEQYAEVLIKQYSPYIKVYLFQLFIYVCVICIYTKYHPVREI